MPVEVGQTGSEVAGENVGGRNDLHYQASVLLGILGGDKYVQTLNQQYGLDVPDPNSTTDPLVTPDTSQPAPAPVVATPVAPVKTESWANRMLVDAEKYIGIPYVYGGTNPQTGLDCSGFVQKVFSDMGIKIPRVTYDQVKSGVQVDDRSQLQSGDLLFFNGDKGHVTNGHVGIYLGDGMMIDAPHTGAKVAHRKVNWSELTAMRRINP